MVMNDQNINFWNLAVVERGTVLSVSLQNPTNYQYSKQLL